LPLQGRDPLINAKAAVTKLLELTLARAFWCWDGLGQSQKQQEIQHVIPKQIKYVWHLHIGNLV
jgi:hypothetical protein